MKNFDPEKDLDFKNITPDETFRAGLRYKLMEKLIRPAAPVKNFMKNVFGKKLLFSMGGALAVLAIALAVFQNLTPSTTTRVAARQGFGPLPSLTAGGLGSGGGMGKDSMALKFSSPEKGSAPAPESKMTGMGMARMTIAPDGEYLPPKITYVWSGKIPDLPAEMEVLRDKPFNLGKGLSGTLAKLTGIGKLGGAAILLQNISVALPGLPYSFNIDQSGRYNVWNNIAYTGDWRQGAPKDITADSELIAVADAFLKELGVDKSAYGEPYVDSSWKDYAVLNGASGKINPAFVPAQASVAYPQTVNGLPAINWSGNDDPGIAVSIDIFQKKAVGVNGRWQVNKDQSLYPTKSKDEIKADILKGGVNPWWGGDQTLSAEQEARRPKIEINLNKDSLKLGYLQQYKYDNGASQTFWIPVLTVKGSFTDQYGSKQIQTVLVPVIQGDFFQKPEVRPLENAK